MRAKASGGRLKAVVRTAAERDAFVADVSRVHVDGAAWSASFVRGRPARSSRANALYRLWLAAIAAETGDDVYALDAWCRRTFIGCDSAKAMGQMFVVTRSAKRLSARQFWAFLERLREHLHRYHGIVLPHPGDRGFDSLEQRFRTEAAAYK